MEKDLVLKGRVFILQIKGPKDIFIFKLGEER